MVVFGHKRTQLYQQLITEYRILIKVINRLRAENQFINVMHNEKRVNTQKTREREREIETDEEYFLAAGVSKLVFFLQ